jgi:serine/threonine protein phosphatase PrpC
MKIDAAACTDLGPVRETNEDYFQIDVENGIFLVADGMGGHAAGEVASRLAVETLYDILLGDEDPDETRLVRDFELVDQTDILRERLRYGLNQASVRVRKEVEDNPETAGMGTTVVALVIEANRAHVAHVGDSRAYLYRNKKLSRLTRDHSVVQREVDAGRLTPELAHMVPHKNILTQSVGFHGPVEPDTSTRIIQADDIFILCSDGLSDPIDDAGLAEIIGQTPVDLLADTLVAAAITANTTDNITVAVIHCTE